VNRDFHYEHLPSSEIGKERKAPLGATFFLLSCCPVKRAYVMKEGGGGGKGEIRSAIPYVLCLPAVGRAVHGENSSYWDVGRFKIEGARVSSRRIAKGEKERRKDRAPSPSPPRREKRKGAELSCSFFYFSLRVVRSEKRRDPRQEGGRGQAILNLFTLRRDPYYPPLSKKGSRGNTYLYSSPSILAADANLEAAEGKKGKRRPCLINIFLLTNHGGELRKGGEREREGAAFPSHLLSDYRGLRGILR